MIADRLRCFGCQALVPIIRMQSITDFNFIRSIDFLMEEAAAKHGKLRRQTAVLLRENFSRKAAVCLRE